MASLPSATNVTVLQVLKRLDSDFAAVANAIENGQFALWVGSGISQKAPNLGDLIDRAVEYLRVRAADPKSKTEFEPALIEALRLAEVDPEKARPNFSTLFGAWPNYKAIRDRLWNKYSRLLDIRVRGRPTDYMLWDVIDIREAFAHAAPPTAEHLCIAILILEGAINEVASANWDEFIESAVKRLGKNTPALLQVVVDPNDLREAAGKARLLKFHGCIKYATADPASFRAYLTGSHTQIIEWPNNPRFAAMRAAVTMVATNLKSMVLGLSIQDANLQGVFAAAKQMHPWQWPSAPDAPAHVFCEDQIREGQRDVLKIVYGDAYNDNMDEIEAAAHLRAWAEQALIALVLKLLCDKLVRLVEFRLSETPLAASQQELADLLRVLRDIVATFAEGDRTNLANRAIAMWSRMLSLFRLGALPADDSYEVLSASTPDQIGGDENAKAVGLSNLAIALALLQHGQVAGLWILGHPMTEEVSSGTLTASASWTGAGERPIFLLRGAREAILLEKLGAFSNSNAIIIHADDVWRLMRTAGTATRRRPRSSPGRTGRNETLHVSMDYLLESCTSSSELKSRFVGEVIL